MKSPSSTWRVDVMIVTSWFSSTVSTTPGTDSSSVTSGYCCRKRGRCFASWCTANAGGTSTRRWPRGSEVAAFAWASASSTSVRIWRTRSRYSSPVSVSARRRVVRLMSRAPRCSSRSATSRVTTAAERFIFRAAPAKLPSSMTRANTRIE